MKKLFLFVTSVILISQLRNADADSFFDKTHDGFLVFHKIKTDRSGKILPWVSDTPGKAFDFVVKAVWRFWENIRIDRTGLPYYMNHQVWLPDRDDDRGIGGDQFAMALSSWTLLYQYTGNEKIKANMKFIADYYLSHGLSPKEALWPDIPFPYNTQTYSGIYDGDMILGKNFTQPDKAGSFGIQLVELYKITGNSRYLNAAVAIADTLCKFTRPGDGTHSPLPFKVNALTGAPGSLKNSDTRHSNTAAATYTTNWAGTLELFEELIRMNRGNTAAYKSAHKLIIAWMRNYPLKTNKWGPFFEDVPGWSDTQINAVTFAGYILLHRREFPNWKEDVQKIFAWVYDKLGNNTWAQYGVRVVNEQTAYQTPGNSHTARQAATELLYAALSGDGSVIENAKRQLFWATYMVDGDGKNCYPRDQIWLTDGYGDYVRHFLRAMAVLPELAPSNANHLLWSSSVVTQITYNRPISEKRKSMFSASRTQLPRISYKTFDPDSVETLRMVEKPVQVTVDGKVLPFRPDLKSDGWTWKALDQGGILKIKHSTGKTVLIWGPPVI